MRSLKKYFIQEQEFEAVEPNGTAVRVGMQDLVRGTVAGYIFSDSSYNVVMTSRMLRIDKSYTVSANIADLGVLLTVDTGESDEGRGSHQTADKPKSVEEHIYIVFAVVDGYLRTLVFNCPVDTGLNEVIKMAEKAYSETRE